MATIRAILHQAIEELLREGLVSARLDAEVLLSRCLGTDRVHLYAHPEEAVPDGVVRGFEALVERRRKKEPVAYIVGEKEFWSVSLAVNRHVLIPRAETEVLVEEALREAAASRDILDIGTGSGAVAIALSLELPRARVVATDRSVAAAVTAAANARRTGVSGRVSVVVSDLLDAFGGPFDLIVSNPPYIPEDEFDTLPPGVRDYEPPEALLSTGDGTAVHRRLVADAWAVLRPGGWLMMEIGEGQAEAVLGVFRADGRYERLGVRKDYGGRERVVKGRKMEV